MAANPSWALRGWSAFTWVAAPLLQRHLRKRIARGKEDPARWREKLGETAALRPDGSLIWLHAVGLGEVLALRGLIHKLNALAPDLSFLVTSNTLGSAQVFAENLPPRTRHQFAPIDTPQAARRFLDHWRPDLAIWAEQELWPGLVLRTDQRGIPLAMVNARMNAVSFTKRKKAAALYADALARFALVSAQDKATAQHLTALRAKAVRVDGSLKVIAPPLAGQRQTDLDGLVWVLASSHPADEAVAIAAHRKVLETNPNAVLVIVPRNVGRAAQISSILPEGDAFRVVDTLGALGDWYRTATMACIGGTFGDTEGHNPWEAVQLDCAVAHGPRTANFAADYVALADTAVAVRDADTLAAAVLRADHAALSAAAKRVLMQKQGQFDVICADLLHLMERS